MSDVDLRILVSLSVRGCVHERAFTPAEMLDGQAHAWVTSLDPHVRMLAIQSLDHDDVAPASEHLFRQCGLGKGSR